jgi:myo-inositol-1(or 4)-monophosphatase
VTAASRTDLATALIATGFGYDAETRRGQAEMVARLLPSVRDIRRLGSAALDLAYVACGRMDIFWERGLNSWDMAAGLILIREAGGFYSDADGGSDPIAKKSVACGNEILHRDLLKLLRQANRSAGS